MPKQTLPALLATKEIGLVLKAQRTAATASRAARFSLFVSLLAVFSALLPLAAFAAPAEGGIGQALALSTALHNARLMASSRPAARTPALTAGESPAGFIHASNGRAITDRNMMRAGAMLRKAAATGATNVVPIPGSVQTFDVNNPLPAFRPLVGYGDFNAPTNNPANPPLYLNRLTPTNLTPVWSQDETFLIFSSNRNLQGGVNHDASDGIGSRFHLWAISVNGGEAYQITASTGRDSGGEFFPALSSSDNFIAFTSDAQSAGVQNLYTSPFSFSFLVADNNGLTTGAPGPLNVSDSNAITSVTIRKPTNVDAFGNPLTGFDQVQRPSFSPVDNSLVVFSAHSVTGTYRGHYHVYYLYTGTGGFDPNNFSLPAKLTDGPADDTDPAYSRDGQFVAFASTASQVTNQGPNNNQISNDPNMSQVITSAVDPNGLRSLFLLGGGGGEAISSPGFGTVPAPLQATGGRVTTAGTDNFGPAWSSVSFNQYTNAPPGFEYLAFARGASRFAPHDIYYLQTARNITAGGETSRSNEAGTTPETIGTPVYLIDAGGLAGNTGSYQTDAGYTLNNVTTANGQATLTLAFGGALGPGVGAAFNQTNDPGTPPGIYNTSRTGASTYLVPFLTPGAQYTLRFHLADPTSTAAGQRVFNINVNGFNAFTNVDLVQQAQQSQGRLGGLVSDTSTGAALPNATISVVDYTSGNSITTSPNPLTTTTATTASPDGSGPINFNGTLQGGTFLVTASAPGYEPVTQVVIVGSAGFSRADFALPLTSTNGTLTGTVTDTTGNTVSTAVVTVTAVVNAANASPGHTADPPVTYGSPIQVGFNGSFTTTLPAGTYNVTATAPGDATLTQQVTITAGATTNSNFALTVPPATGALIGLVSDSGSTAVLGGATITVRQGGAVVAILNTSAAASNAPAAPNGDGKPANYSTLLPAGNYQLTVQAYGYKFQQLPVTVTAAGFVRQDVALVNNNAAPAGQSTAVVLTTTAIASTFAQTVTLPGGTATQTLNAGGLIIQFVPVKGDPIVQGIDVLTNSDAATSSGFGGSNVASVTGTGGAGPTNLTAIGGDGQVTLTFTPPTAAIPPTAFNIFRSPVTASSLTSVNQTGSGAGTEGNTPFVTIPFDPTQARFQVTYIDKSVTNGTEYFYQVSAIFQEQITPEGIQLKTSAGLVPNTVIKLNTDDNAGQTSAGGNAFDDVYPTWSPFLSIFSIAYTSNRTVTYNNPTTSFPSETAFSVGANGTVAGLNSGGSFTGYSVGPNYSGLMESQVLNLDPPILLRFSSDEIVHVQAFNPNDPVNGTPTKSGINPGQKVTLTVRMSDREAGIDNGNSGLATGGANPARPQVFVQIKDPTSKYQNIPKLEHKVFARDFFYNSQANRPLNDVTSGTVNGAGNIGFFGLSLDDPLVSGLRDKYPTYGFNGGYVSPRGAHGGFYQQNGNDPTPSTIFVGKNGGGTNPNTILSKSGSTTVSGFAPGTDPNLFTAWGPEYECQFINPQFLTSPNQSNQGQQAGDAAPEDYGTPYYLAGVDDFQAFSGAGKQRPTQNTLSAQGRNLPAEWLQMDISPVQDNRGGVLYTVTWTTPTSATDFYLDVIAFDKAVFPAFPPGTSTYSGKSVNWRIYDNVGGFSTNQSIGNNDILVVSDYALGQKFAATTFNGTRGNLNLVPKLYGAESYFTDVDVNILPDSVYAGYPKVPGGDPPFVPFIKQFYVGGPKWENGLGVGSYDDGIIDNGLNGASTVDGVPYVQSQRYSIWRILSRGPVTSSVLSSYLPTKQSQPPVNDLQGPAAYQKILAATVLDAHRCVVWLSPYTGDLLTDPGALDDIGEVSQTLGNGMVTAGRPPTTTVLRNFVQAGGRLFLSGQDAGSALTIGGTANNGQGGFLYDVLNAEIGSTGGGTTTLTAPGDLKNIGLQYSNRITGYPEYDGSSFPVGFYPVITGAIAPNDNNISDSSFNLTDPGGEPFRSRLELGDDTQNDSSLSQRRGPSLPSGASLLGQPDTLLPQNNALTALNYSNGTVAMVYHDDPYNAAGTGVLPNGGTGARTVYAGFGLEALSNDAYSSDGANPDTSHPLNIFVPAVAPRNPRTNILHNIVCYLRTGFVNGVITQTSGGNGQGAGQGVPGVTVYLIPASGTAPPTRPTFSAITKSGGTFSIIGVEPGTYTIAAYKAGYTHAVSNPGVYIAVEGDAISSASLTVKPLQPGSISGRVQDTSGNVITGATVSFTSKDQNYTQTGTTTAPPAADNSNYLIQNVQVDTYTGIASGPNNPNGNPEYLPASAPDAGPPNNYDQGVTVNSNQPTPGVNFTLTPILASVTGIVYDATPPGTPGTTGLAGVSVTLTDSTGKVYGPFKTYDGLTAAPDKSVPPKGTYIIQNIPASGTVATTYTITAMLAGFNTTNNTAGVSVFLGDMKTNVDIGLLPTPKGSVSGTVFLPDNKTPVAGATVTITSGDGTVKLSAVTAADGTYTIAGVPPSTYTAAVVGPLNPHGRPQSKGAVPLAPFDKGFTVSANTVTQPVNFDVTLIPPSFAGTITNATTKQPLVDATVTATNVGTGVVAASTKSDGAGNYGLGPLAPGTYTVTAALAGFQTNALVGADSGNPTPTQIIVYYGDVLVGQNIALTPLAPGTVSGTVLDPSGNPIVGAKVTFVSTDGSQTTFTATTGDGTNPAIPIGTYSIPSISMTTGIAAASYTGNASGPFNSHGRPEYTIAAAPTSGNPVVVTPGGTVNANFVLTPILPTITGQVTDAATGAPIPGATVTLTPLTAAGLPVAGGVPTQVTTDAAGNYASGSLQPGTYSAAVTAAGYFDGSTAAPLTVMLGDALTQPFMLNKKATLYGLITDASTGAPLSGVSVTVTTSSGAVVSTVPASVTTTAATTAGPDGQPFNYELNVAPGTYTITAIKANYVTQGIASVTLNNVTPVRVDFRLISTIGTLGGLVTNSTDSTPVAGVTVTVTDANSNVVATFLTNGAAVSAPDGGQTNYLGSLAKGTYTVTIKFGTRTPISKSVTVLGGQFNRLDFTGATGLSALHTFPAGLNFLSAPYDYSAVSFDSLFGALNTAPVGTAANGNRSRVAVWDPLQSAYALDPNAPADALRLGVGYWIFLKNPVNLTQQGASPNQSFQPVTLHAFWNQIGVPNPNGVPVSNLMFDNGSGGKISFSQAVSAQYHVVSPTLYRYDSVSGTYQPVVAGDTLAPWQAYWIKVFVDATLEIPTGFGTTPTTGTSTGTPPTFP